MMTRGQLDDKLKISILNELGWKHCTFRQDFQYNATYCIIEKIAIDKQTRLWVVAPSDEKLEEHDEDEEQRRCVEELRNNMKIGFVQRKMPLMDTIIEQRCDLCTNNVTAEEKCKRCNGTKYIKLYKQLIIKAEVYVITHCDIKPSDHTSLPDCVFNFDEGQILDENNIHNDDLLRYLNELDSKQTNYIENTLKGTIGLQNRRICNIPISIYTLKNGFKKKVVVVYGVNNKFEIL